MKPLPSLRPLDVSVVEQDGKSYFCLRDGEGYVEEQMLLAPLAFFIASCLDGQHDVAAIQEAIRKQIGVETVPEEIVYDVVNGLDEIGFLLTPRFAERFRTMTEAFHQSPTRPAYLAGKSYPDDTEELRVFLDSMYTRETGPGHTPAEAQLLNGPIRFLVAPHIDFERGGHSYAHGYLRLAQGPKPETIFVFGVAHNTPPVPFILTRKDFETPFGMLRNDTTIVDRLAKALSYDPYEYEFIHRSEHSIEFQAVALAHAIGVEARIVPVLCGLCPGETQAAPSSSDIQHFLACCNEIVTQGNGRVAVIAAADLAHVGQTFGDDFEIDDETVEKVHARDRDDLAFVTALDADGWYRSVMKDGNQRRVCGLNCIYAALKSVENTPLQSELLHYDHASDPGGGIVSFSSIVAF